MQGTMDNIEAWREVHNQLLLSIAITKDSINVEKAKRRLLLEELYTHVTPEGTSLWTKQKQGGQKKHIKIVKKKKSSDEGGVDVHETSTKKRSSKSTSTSSTSSSKKKKSTPITRGIIYNHPMTTRKKPQN